ncbi:hypothetical protein MMC07_007594 [Pseudocyphellaria aurata]|nr:hypothetical protein [Pseudocyphellaria aurata]
MLDGVGSRLGRFDYPPQDAKLTFNFRDTVNASWTTFDDAHSSGLLTFSYWPGKDPWTLGRNTSVPLNSSMIVDLNEASGSSLGQFYFSLGLVDGIDANYSSEIFNITHNPSEAPLPWAGPASSPSSTTRASSLERGAIAGISVGSSLGLGVLILAAILFALRRRRRRRRRRSQASQSGMLQPFQSPIEMPASSSSALVELAGQEVQHRELSGHTAARELAATDGNLVRGELSAPGISDHE